ncbi:somatostatin receptor type 5-like isoform X2 [Styela clava]|uniref:somatostatin receptor type 2-like isoform X2 n=1 Tax=Styela clava TaxID=7725 RepID=UPI00193A31EA|nr:somatostatin receptor type 2-like isoform X2 [Styela clava]
MAEADFDFDSFLESLQNMDNGEDDGASLSDILSGESKNCADERNVTMSVFMILIVIVGLFGNAIVFFVILVLKEYKKSVSNWYVLQLALADTLFLLMLPFTASDTLAGQWDFSQTLCKAKEGILFVNYYASIFFLTIMSFDRYMAVTKSGVSKWADILRRLDSAAVISLVAWLISICLAVPIYLYSKVNLCKQCSYDFPLTDIERCTQAGINATSCPEWIKGEENATIGGGLTEDDFIKIFDDDLFKNFTDQLESDSAKYENLCRDETTPYMYRVWLYLNLSLLLILPFVLICGFYGMILRTMMGTTVTASTSQRQYRRRVTFMVLALVSLFAVSWVPWYAVMMARIPGFPLSPEGCAKLGNFTRILSYLNSALNPYFYSLLSMRFPTRLTAAFARSRRMGRNVSGGFGSRNRSKLHGIQVPQKISEGSQYCQP